MCKACAFIYAIERGANKCGFSLFFFYRAARPQGNLFTTKMYGPHAYAPRYGLRHLDGGSSSDSMDEDELWMDSPWPARNAPCFDLLNNFMERFGASDE